MDLGVELSSINTIYASLLSSESFSQYLEPLNEQQQLEFCQNIFQTNILVQQRSHELVFRASEWINTHHLYLQVKKTQLEYWEEANNLYQIKPIIETERRKLKAQEDVQSTWKRSVSSFLGPLCPENPSRNLLEGLATFAQICNDPSDAIKLLRERADKRPPRSRTTQHIIAGDVEWAISAYRSQQKQGKSGRDKNKKKPGRNKRKKKFNQIPASEGSPSPTKTMSDAPSDTTSTLSSLHSSDLEISGNEFGQEDEETQESLSQSSSPAKALSDAASVTASDLSSLRSSDLKSPKDESGQQDEEYAEVLRRFCPVDIPNLNNCLQEELDRLHRTVPRATWGEIYLGKISRILMYAQPARIYVEGVPAGVRYGLYTTSSRETADILSLDGEAARRALAIGPPDGKSVLIRSANDHRGLEAHDFLTYFERYRMIDITIQDPTTSKDKSPGLCGNSVMKRLRQVSEGDKTVGYGSEQLPPLVLPLLSSLCSSEPACLQTEATRIHHLLCSMNPQPGFPALESAYGSVLAAHMAITPPCQDQDGYGKLLHGLFGYSIWILWPSMTPDQRSRFHEQGVRYSGHGARYLVIGPYDQYIQTPCLSQDVHAVIYLGYCGVSACSEICIKHGHPRCCGLVAMDTTNYWHAHFMADSVISRMEELESKSEITNCLRQSNLAALLADFLSLVHRDEAILGGPDACRRLEEVRKQYLREIQARRDLT